MVFGGSGFIGRNVVRALVQRGWRVRVAVRRPHLAQFLRTTGAVGQVQLFQASISYRDSVARALEGMDAAVNLVGILYESGSRRFEDIQTAGASSVATLAREAGTQALVHVSAIGADRDSDSIYARTKGEGEAAVLHAFPDASVLRPSVVFGPEDTFFNRFASMAVFSPALPLIGGGKTLFQPVYADDVARAVCTALVRPEARGKTYELGGPQVYSFRELMEIMLKETGRRRLLVPLPFPLASLAGKAGRIAGMLPFVVPPLTDDQVRLLRHDNIVGKDGVHTFGDLGISPVTLESVLPSYMERYRRYGRFSRKSG